MCSVKLMSRGFDHHYKPLKPRDAALPVKSCRFAHHEQSSDMYCALLNIMTPHICASRLTCRSVRTQMAKQQQELITGASTAKKTIKFGLSSHASQQHFLCHHMIWQTRDYYSTWLVPYFEPLWYPPPLLQHCLQPSLSTRPQSRHGMCNEAFVSAYVSVYSAQCVGVWCVYTLHTVNTCMGALQSFNKSSQSGGKLPWIMMIFFKGKHETMEL